MGEAIQDILILSNPSNRLPVVLLIQEESGFLPVFHVHLIAHAVFHNLGHRLLRQRLSRQRVPPFALFHPFQLSDRHIVAQINPPHRLPQSR